MKLSRFVATAAGVGLLRPAPGTWGSLAAIALGVFLHRLGHFPLLALATCAAVALGFWSVTREVEGKDDKDPSELFDIWGSTVNRAARLEQAGAAGMINISEDARVHVKDFFDLESRGAILTKEKQGVDMYFVTGAHTSLRSGEQSLLQSFAERYRVYFQETLDHLPDSMLGQRG